MSNEQYLVSPEEEFKLSMMRLRSERNLLLAETDFYALSDVTMSPEMETYCAQDVNVTIKLCDHFQKYLSGSN